MLTMKARNQSATPPRRTFLKAAAGITAGTVLTRGTQWAQSGRDNAATLSKIDSRQMITPDVAWDWNVFKARCGPTYAGSTGWKQYTDFLIAKLQEFGAVDLDTVEIPYDHYIVDDWPDRRAHEYASGMAVEKLVSNVPAVTPAAALRKVRRGGVAL